MSITKAEIEKILHDLTAKKFYRNEAQLQFDLAWEIRNYFVKEKITDWHIELEYLAATSKKTNKKGKVIDQNYYVDIMLISDKGEFIPIELKYKTKSILNGEQKTLKTHGAQDLGRFDYLWDVKRIEALKSKKICKIELNINPQLKKFIYGFAIMLTNDELYYKITKKSLAPKTPAYIDFCIGDGQVIGNKTPLSWGTSKSLKILCNWRNKVCPIVFDNNYMCNWDVLTGQSNNFKDLILEIN